MTARRWFARIVLVTVPAAGVVVGLTTARLARRADTASLAGRDPLADILLLAVGWALIIAGLVLIRRAADRTAGMLLTAAGFAWFIADWDNQFADSPILFTAGLIGAAVCPVLVGHAVLRYHSGPLDRLGRLGLLLGYTGTVLIGGLLPAMFFDPIAQGCSSCATNVLAVQSIPSMVAWPGRAAVLLGPMWCGLLAVAIGRQVVGALPAGRRRDGPVLVPGIGYLAAVAGTYLLAIPASFVPTTPATRLLWLVQGGCLLLLAAGTGWPSVQRRLTRARVARLVVDIAAVPPVGGLSSMLARSLRDPSFLVLYPAGDHSMVDAGGHPSAPGERPTMTRGGPGTPSRYWRTGDRSRSGAAGAFLLPCPAPHDQPDGHQPGDDQQPPVLDLRLLIAEDQQHQAGDAQPEQKRRTTGGHVLPRAVPAPFLAGCVGVVRDDGPLLNPRDGAVAIVGFARSGAVLK